MKFDDLCRVIASPLPRREVFRLILASLVAAVAPSSRLAANGSVVKEQVIDINAQRKTWCESQLANRPARVTCPPGTEKKVIVTQSCTQIFDNNGDDHWVAQVVVQCTEPQLSPP
jgi:hypothetical protein